MKRTASVGGRLKRLGSRAGGGTRERERDEDTSSMGSGVAPLKRKNSIAGAMGKSVKGVKHIGQTPFVFKFEILVEYIDKLSYNQSQVVVVWERGKNLFSTRPSDVDPVTKRATFNDALAKEVTLFKPSHEDREFVDKIYKIAIRARSATGNTLGKIHINFADYAVIPSSSRKVAANLSNGAVLVAKISAVLVPQSSRKKHIGRGSSIAASSDAGSLDDQSLSELGSDEPGDKDKDSFGDLISDEEEVEEKSVPSERKKKPEPEDVDDSDHSEARGTRQRIKNKMHLQRRQSVDLSTGSSSTLQMTQQMEKEVAILKRKLAEANKRVKELSAQNSKLMEDLAAEEQYDALGRDSSKGSRSGGLGSKATLQAIVTENKKLKDKLDEVTEILDREPEVEEMVHELKELKMTLAISNLEKDQAVLEAAQMKKELGVLQGGAAGAQKKGAFYKFW